MTERKLRTTQRIPRSIQGASPRRSRQRGAAVFVVLMAILLLTGLGVWAVKSAALTNSATGYQRAAAQSLYTAELGVLSGTGYLSVPGNPQAVFAAANSAPDTCTSVPATSDNLFCKSIFLEEVNDPILTASGYNVLDLVNAEGSLSPYANTDAAALEGDFFIEMSDPQSAILAGTEIDGPNSDLYQRVTLTSYGTIRPVTGNICSGSDAQNSVASRVGMRAYAIVGPVK